MKKIKECLFRIFKNTIPLFTGLGINRKILGLGRIYDFFYKLFWPYNKIIEIQGSKMLIDSKDTLPQILKTFESYAQNLVHEKVTTEFFKKNIKERDTVVDLGANIGYFTLLAAKLVGPEGKVYAFEPEPKNFSYLKKNVEINSYSQVSINQKAVSNKNGKTQLYICSYDTGHHTINKYDGIDAYSRGRFTEEKAIEIETVTLDSFLEGKTNHVDVIKMDVEGAEMLALLGMDKTLRKNDKIKMFIEFFPLLIEKMGSSPEKFIHKLLKDYQFSIFVIPDDYDAAKGEMIRINSTEEIMNLCGGEKDHVNLFLEKDDDKITSQKN